MACYARAKVLGKAGDLDGSSHWHSGIHLVGNVANCFLYADLREGLVVRRLAFCVVYVSLVAVAVGRRPRPRVVSFDGPAARTRSKAARRRGQVLL